MNALAEARDASAKYGAQTERRVLAGFAELATSAGGVMRLRELIRTLAVRGRLLPQDGRDRPARSTLDILRVEKQRLIDTGTIRKDRVSQGNEDLTLDFELPSGWELVQLSDVAWPQAGFAFKSSAFNESGKGLPLIRIRDVGSDAPTTFFDGEFRHEFIVREGDWLIGMDGDFRVAPWKGPDALLNQRVTRLVFFGYAVQPLYVCLALQQELRKLQGTKAYTTVDHLSGGQIASRVIPLPPLAEQQRIVARVEELMKLCDALEQSGRLADEQHARLTSTLFDALAASESAHALAENWLRVAEHFDLLLDRTDAIDALENTVDALAIRGLLVRQAPGAEPASTLLARLAALTAKGDKAPKPIQSFDLEELPFELPSGWTWVQAQDLCRPSSLITYGILKPVWVGVGVPTVRVQDMQNGKIIVDAVGQCSPERAEKFGKTKLEAGDLLIAKDGATLGKTAVVPPSLAGGNITQHVLRFPITPHVDQQFVRLVIDSPHGQAWMKSETKGVALPGVNVGDFRRMPVPLPPLAEQRRIVARVIELRLLCASLRQQVTEAGQVQTRLADALVAEVA